MRLAAAAMAFFVLEASAQESVPPGPGATLLLEACVQCHDLRPIAGQRKAEGAWRRTVNEMIWRGAPLLPGEADLLTRYLATSFGPSTPGARPASAAPDPAARTLPAGSARALVLKACVGCHDLETTVGRRKTPEQWRRSVDVMVRLGARLDASEIPVVADYLATFLGPRASAGGQP